MSVIKFLIVIIGASLLVMVTCTPPSYEYVVQCVDTNGSMVLNEFVTDVYIPQNKNSVVVRKDSIETTYVNYQCQVHKFQITKKESLED